MKVQTLQLLLALALVLPTLTITLRHQISFTSCPYQIKVLGGQNYFLTLNNDDSVGLQPQSTSDTDSQLWRIQSYFGVYYDIFPKKKPKIYLKLGENV